MSQYMSVETTSRQQIDPRNAEQGAQSCPALTIGLQAYKLLAISKESRARCTLAKRPPPLQASRRLYPGSVNIAIHGLTWEE